MRSSHCCPISRFGLPIVALLGIGVLVACAAVAAQNGNDREKAPAGPAASDGQKQWRVHDRSRPQPKAVTPGDQPGQPPSDAIILFDGKDLSKWQTDKGENPTWTVDNGAMTITKGGIRTRDSFGDCQLHVEWQSPTPPKGKDQDRGNSGIHLMGRYEFQVLDNYQSETYADGMAGSIYGQYPPQVNACRPPGQWNVYDIVFHGPRFDAEGKLLKPARATVLLNGVLVQDNVELKGPTSHKKLAQYTKHAATGPISLQDHNHPVKYRNIWLRPIPTEHPVAPTMPAE